MKRKMQVHAENQFLDVTVGNTNNNKCIWMRFKLCYKINDETYRFMKNMINGVDTTLRLDQRYMPADVVTFMSLSDGVVTLQTPLYGARIPYNRECMRGWFAKYIISETECPPFEDRYMEMLEFNSEFIKHPVRFECELKTSCLTGDDRVIFMINCTINGMQCDVWCTYIIGPLVNKYERRTIREFIRTAGTAKHICCTNKTGYGAYSVNCFGAESVIVIMGNENIDMFSVYMPYSGHIRSLIGVLETIDSKSNGCDK